MSLVKIHVLCVQQSSSCINLIGIVIKKINGRRNVMSLKVHPHERGSLHLNGLPQIHEMYLGINGQP